MKHPATNTIFSAMAVICLTVIWTAFLLLAASAGAIPTAPSGYGLNSSLTNSKDFWSISDIAPGHYESPYFPIQIEEASYESGFGFYAVENTVRPASVRSRFELFPRNAEKGDWSTVSFWNDGGKSKMTDQFKASTPDTSSWMSIANWFGFYYDGGAGADAGMNSMFDTGNNQRTEDTGIEQYTAYHTTSQSAYIYLEDLLAENAELDRQDITAPTEDVQSAPVPDSANMLLVGLGLVGFAFITRRGMGFKH